MPFDVDVDHLLPILDAQVVEERSWRNARVVDQNIELAVPLQGQLDEVGQVPAPLDVCRCVSRFAAGIRDARRQRLKAIRSARAKHDLRTEFSEQQCSRLSNTTARARDYDDFSFGIRHEVTFQSRDLIDRSRGGTPSALRAGHQRFFCDAQLCEPHAAQCWTEFGRRDRAAFVGAPVPRQASDCRLIPPQIWKAKSQFDDNGSYLQVFRRRSAAFLRVFTVSVSSLYFGPMTGMYHCDASLAGPEMTAIVMSDLSSTREHQGSPAICFNVVCDCSARDTRLPPASTSLRILSETFSLAVFGSSPGHSTTFKGTFPWVAA